MFLLNDEGNLKLKHCNLPCFPLSEQLFVAVTSEHAADKNKGRKSSSKPFSLRTDLLQEIP